MDEGPRNNCLKETAMRYLVVFSTKDEAGINISKHLKLYPKPPFEVFQVEKDLIELQAGDIPESDLVIFASKHVGKRPSFTVHVSGNPGSSAPFGGLPRSLSMSAPLPMLFCLESMVKLAVPGFEVTYEVTHHGPSFLKTPSFFAELGSGPEQWSVEEYAGVVAESIYKAAELAASNIDVKTALGLGGPHYAPNITRYALRNRVAVGHIIQGSILEEEDDIGSLLRLALDANGKTDTVLIDWKGVNGATRAKILTELKLFGLPVIRVRAVRRHFHLVKMVLYR